MIFGSACGADEGENQRREDAMTSDPKKARNEDAFILVQIQMPASAFYRLISSSTMVSSIHEANSTTKVFSDILEQEAWDAYKEIELRYRSANQRLA
jgi:hypothetical protein